ncbi:hypothetical protein CF319_g1610 [Tilletia indica]|nr:hypothetical protein CF319_g1610 [Tilletia indica]
MAMADNSEPQSPTMPMAFNRGLHEHRRFAVIRRVAHILAPTRIPDTSDEEDDEDGDDASDSDSETSQLETDDEDDDCWDMKASKAKAWDTDEKMAAALHKACRSYSRHFSTGSDGPDLFEHNRSLMLSKLAMFPEIPTKPFLKITDTLSAMAIHYLYVLNTFAMQTDDEKERGSERDQEIDNLENTIVNLRERIRLFKEDVRVARKKEKANAKGATDQRNPRLMSLETFELEKEIRYLRAEIVKRDNIIVKKETELGDLKEIMTHRDEQHSKRISAAKTDLQRHKDNAQTLLNAKNNHIALIRAELVGIADGTIPIERSHILASERQSRAKGNAVRLATLP